MSSLVKKISGNDYKKGVGGKAEAKAQAKKVGAKVGKASVEAKAAHEKKFGAPVSTVMGGVLDKLGERGSVPLSGYSGGKKNPLNRPKNPQFG